MNLSVTLEEVARLMLFTRHEPTSRNYIMAFRFVVTVKGILQMRGGLTQATAFLISRYGSVDDGIDAGARILPEWLLMPPKSARDSVPPPFTHGSAQHPAQGHT